MLRIRSLRAAAAEAVSFPAGRSFPSIFWLRVSWMVWEAGLRSTGLRPGPTTAWANAPDTVEAGE